MEHLRLFRYVTYMKDYDSLGPGSALGEKREKKSEGEKKIIRQGKRTERYCGRGKGGGTWRHAFDAADLPSSK